MKLKLIIIFLCLSVVINAQKVVFNGTIYNTDDKEPVAGAIIRNVTENTVVVSNNFGNFSLLVNKGTTNNILITFVGCDTIFYSFNTDKNISKTFFLKQGVSLNAVKVVGKKKYQSGVYTISQQEIKILPSLTGDFDLLKSFQYLPGIQFGVEGTSNLYILGGSPDQNLITLDGLPLFYVAHYGSIVSVIDIEAVRSAELIKSGFAPKYGGRLSGYLDVLLKDGDMQKRNVVIDIGLLSAKISSNGYIIKNKLSYLISLRRSNLDWQSQALRLINKSEDISGYNFYDANFKLNYIVNNNNKLQLNAYAGQDRMYTKLFGNRSTSNEMLLPGEVAQKTPYSNSSDVYKWGNQAIAFKWLFHKNRIFANTIIGYTKFKNASNDNIKQFDVDGNLYKQTISQNNAFIQYYLIKSILTFKLSNSFALNAGQEYDYYSTVPISFSNQTFDSTGYAISKFSLKEPVYSRGLYSAFFDLNYNIRQKFYAKLGLRINCFSKKVYYSPRIRFIYSPNEKITFNLSYTKTYQFVHLIGEGTSTSARDIWILAKERAVPENSTLYDFNTEYDISKEISFSMGIFSKDFQNLIDYKRLVYNPNTTLMDRLEYDGTGKASGIYSIINISFKKFNSWLSYTYIDNTRHFDNLNNGKPYPSYYSRKHNLNLVLSYKINKHWFASASFVFASGMPYTIPVFSQNTVFLNDYVAMKYGQFASYNELEENYYFNNEIFKYNEINNYTLPAYHRLDLAVKYLWKSKNKKIDYAFSFNIYNVYNRMNPFYVYGKYDSENNKIEYHKVTQYPFFPSFAFEIRFDL